jgi:GAF domain-containing protein
MTLSSFGQASASDAFAELDSAASSEQPLTAALERTAELAKAVLRIPMEASVTLIDADEATTPAFTARLAVDLDETQYALGYGPCLAAAEGGQLISIADMATESRWPQFTKAASEQGVGSTLSVPLPVQRQVIGALNMYSTDTAAFDTDAVTLAEKFGTYAAAAVANTRLYLSTAQLAEQMAEAMTSRAVIEQAKGILMAQRHCHADEAFNVLVGLSQTTHRKLRDVAAALIEHTLGS